MSENKSQSKPANTPKPSQITTPPSVNLRNEVKKGSNAMNGQFVREHKESGKGNLPPKK